MRAALAAVVVVFAVGTARADGPVAQFKSPRQPHADVPFNLDLQVEGFEESPAPTQPKLDIANAEVQPVGIRPNTMHSIQIDATGRRRDEVRVTWDLIWRVVPHVAGPLHIPNVTVKQGSKSATARGGFRARALWLNRRAPCPL